MFNHSAMFDSQRPHGLQHPRLPCPPLLELAQIHVHWLGDANQPSHPLHHLFLLPSAFPSIRVLPTSWFFISGGQSIGASASVLPVNIKHRFPLGLTCLIPLWSKELSSHLQHHSSKASILQCSAFFMAHISHSYMITGKTIALNRHMWLDGKVMSLSRFVIAFLPKGKHLLISWLQSPSAVILEPKKRKSIIASAFSPSICHEVMGLYAIILVFWMLHIKPAFSLSTFTLIKRLFTASSCSAIRVVSFAQLRLLIFLLEILIPACDSSHPAFRMMYSAYGLLWGIGGKESTCNAGVQKTQVQSLGWKIPWRRAWQPTLVFLPRESHEQGSLVGYSP